MLEVNSQVRLGTETNCPLIFNILSIYLQSQLNNHAGPKNLKDRWKTSGKVIIPFQLLFWNLSLTTSKKQKSTHQSGTISLLWKQEDQEL